MLTAEDEITMANHYTRSTLNSIAPELQIMIAPYLTSSEDSSALRQSSRRLAAAGYQELIDRVPGERDTWYLTEFPRMTDFLRANKTSLQACSPPCAERVEALILQARSDCRWHTKGELKDI